MKFFASFVIIAVAAPVLGAQTQPTAVVADSQSSVVISRPALSATPPLYMDLPIVDAPYNVAHGVRAPSMAQSLAVAEGFYEVTHTEIQRAWGSHHVLSGISLVLFDTFGGLLPGGDAWEHEEYHRAVLGNRGIGSFNDVYKFDLSASTIAVSHVKDDDLVRLKATHPAEQVRLGSAGIEGENQLVFGLEKNRFFHGSTANNVPMYWLTKLDSYAYVSLSSTEVNNLTNDMNTSDGANVPARDFTGDDFTGWVYDLHRPTEPYAARGVHPSGVGIDRYIKYSDLTPEEHDYLAEEGRLQLINFLDPNLLGITGVTVRSPWKGAPLRLNVNASHYLTSFGHTVDVNLFLKQDGMNVLVSMRRYSNGARSFPGLEAQLLDLSTTVAGVPVDLSPRVALWLQPEHQDFRTSSARPGMLASLRIRRPGSAMIGTFVELEGKTEGWVAGNVNLDPNVSIRIGGSVKLN